MARRLRHFYVYEPPRELEEIEGDIKRLEGEILKMLKQVTT
jgi:type I restriction enzyme M protein